MKKNLIRSFILAMMALTLSNCASTYKSTWDCPKVKGIGCSSVEYADMVALEQIKQKYSKKYKSTCCNDCHNNKVETK